MKVLVTGAAGFIGSAVVRNLSDNGIPVVGVDGLLDGLYPSAEKRTRFESMETFPGVSLFELDLRTDSLDALPQDITHVINEAAMPGLSLSWTDFELYSTCNLTAVQRLLDYSRRWPLEKFIQISTSSVYGRNAVGDETIPLQPVSPYGVTKLAAENLALAYWRDAKTPVAILRYFSVYGPGQRPDMAYRKFITKAQRKETIDLYGSGEQSRSNTYIDDCVSATVSALTHSREGEIYNISGQAERSIKEALTIIEELSGGPLSINYLPTARGDQERTFGDSSKAQRELGFAHTVSLEEGLRRQFEWQKTLG